MSKKVLFVVYQSPVGSVWVNEAFRTAFGMYGEDVEPALLLVNEGVVALARECKPERLGLLSVKMVQRYVKRYGTPVYAVGEDLDAYGVRDVDEGFSAQTAYLFAAPYMLLPVQNRAGHAPSL